MVVDTLVTNNIAPKKTQTVAGNASKGVFLTKWLLPKYPELERGQLNKFCGQLTETDKVRFKPQKTSKLLALTLGLPLLSVVLPREDSNGNASHDLYSVKQRPGTSCHGTNSYVL